MTAAKAAEALQKYGKNALTPPPKKNPFMIFCHYLSGLFNVMLLIAGILSFVVYAIPPAEGSDRDGSNIVLGSILIVVTLLNAFLEFYQEYKSSSLLESFKVSKSIFIT